MIKIQICFLFIISFSLKASIKHAQNFQIEQKEGYQLLTVNNAWRSKDQIHFEYALVHKESPIPENLNIPIIQTPVSKVIALSSPHVSFLAELNLLSNIVGISSKKYVLYDEVTKRLEQGLIQEIGEGSSRNMETIISTEPDLVFSTSIGNPDYDVHPQLKRMGIPSAVVASYMEKTLLGRAEWIKFVAVFFELDEEANLWFDQIEKEYKQLLDRVKGVTDKPSICNNGPYGDAWYVPGGNSYMANVIRDAKGQFIWEGDVSSGSRKMSFESVYAKYLDADIWLNIGMYTTLKDILKGDERFRDFKSVRNKQVYNNNRRLTKAGGNHYWGHGVTHPHLILSDMIKIFHPERMLDREFTYFQQLK